MLQFNHFRFYPNRFVLYIWHTHVRIVLFRFVSLLWHFAWISTYVVWMDAVWKKQPMALSFSFQLNRMWYTSANTLLFFCLEISFCFIDCITKPPFLPHLTQKLPCHPINTHINFLLRWPFPNCKYMRSIFIKSQSTNLVQFGFPLRTDVHVILYKNYH